MATTQLPTLKGQTETTSAYYCPDIAATVFKSLVSAAGHTCKDQFSDDSRPTDIILTFDAPAKSIDAVIQESEAELLNV